MKVLLVDDDKVSLTKLRVIIEPFGQCETARNGDEAVEAFHAAWDAHFPYDLICLDISMPGKDGTEVLFEIREAEMDMNVAREKPAKVLMITSHRDKDSVITSVQAGCDGYLVKPFSPKDVHAKLKQLGFKPASA